MMSSLHILLIVLLLIGFSASQNSEKLQQVLIVSLDGFRNDYLRVAQRFGIGTPNFDRVISEGVTIEYPGLTNAFPTITLPNHYTLVTGLYPESHGIVSNSFFDPVFNETFNHDTEMELKWWLGTGAMRVRPIWMTNEGAGNHRASGVCWPGGDVKGQRAKYYTPSFNESEPFKSRIDKIIKWFTAKSDPINFGALYFFQPDETGHQHGPESLEVAQVVGKLDTDLGYLLQSLEKNHLLNKMDIILTSDHGMTKVLDNATVYLDDHVNPALYSLYSVYPILHVLPKAGSYDFEYKIAVSIVYYYYYYYFFFMYTYTLCTYKKCLKCAEASYRIGGS